jgi:hypothetical protein
MATWKGKNMKKTAVLLAFLLMSVSNASAALTNKVVSTKYVEGALQSLDAKQVGADGSYIQYVSETDGIVSATTKAFDSSVTANSTNAVQGRAVFNALKVKQNELHGVAPITVDQSKLQVSVSNATKDAVGVVKYGAIPTASDGTGEAFMWVE